MRTRFAAFHVFLSEPRFSISVVRPLYLLSAVRVIFSPTGSRRKKQLVRDQLASRVEA